MSGTLFIVSSPSGGGKTSLVRALIETMPNLATSLSCTTRPQRPDEIDGVHYQFISEEKFLNWREKGEFLEWAHVFGHYYATSKTWIEQHLQQGMDIFLAIDWQGARQLRTSFQPCKSVFILPPSLQTLEARLLARKQDSLEVIKQRMEKAKAEMSHYNEYDYVIINEDLDMATRELAAIVTAARLTIEAQQVRHKEVMERLEV
jgi:guanylate kinase